MNKETKKLRGIVFGSLDALESACKVALKAFETESMSIDVYFSFLDKAKWSTDTDNVSAKEYATNYNNMLDAVKSCILATNNLRINIDGIISINNTIKGSFNIGANK